MNADESNAEETIEQPVTNSTAVVEVACMADGKVISAEAVPPGTLTKSQHYKVVSTMLMFFQMIHGYLGCLVDYETVDGLPAEITHRMVALLRKFNLR